MVVLSALVLYEKQSCITYENYYQMMCGIVTTQRYARYVPSGPSLRLLRREKIEF